MLDNGIATDVTFVVSCNWGMFDQDAKAEGDCTKEAEEIKAHKYQLICRSPVFDTMLCGDLADKGNIVVEDIEPEAFKQMLNYINTDQVNIWPELAMPILYTSKKYMITSLTQICVDNLDKTLSTTNACNFYDHSLLFEEKELTKRSFYLIKNQTKACIQSSSLKYVRQTTLSRILDSERFDTSEINIFNACVTWAKYQVQPPKWNIMGEKLRQVLGDCVGKIRYPAMEIEDFGTIVSSSEVLHPAEKLAVFRFLASKGRNWPLEIYQTQDRRNKGPFVIQYDGECSEVSVKECRTHFDVIASQDIAIKNIHLCEIEPGSERSSSNDEVELVCSEVHIDGIVCKIKSFYFSQTGAVISLAKRLWLTRNFKHTITICLTYNQAPCSINRSLKLRCSISKEARMKNTATGLSVSISCNKHMFLHGFTYDYDRYIWCDW